MRALSDTLLAGGCAVQLEAIHGEPVTVLQGPDAGRTFIGVVETESDLILATELGNDPRGKLMVRFRPEQTPRIQSQCQVTRLSDGKKYNAVRQDFSAFLTNDFELKEIVEGKDT